jgi:hypothetical protein
MLSALKRIVNNNNNSNNTQNAKDQHPQQKTNGMQSISQTLQKKFAKGVNYNSKFIK